MDGVTQEHAMPSLEKTRRVLMIAAAWPPMNAPGSRRPLRLARRLPKLGWTPVVLTTDPPGGWEVDGVTIDGERDAPGIEVHRVRALWPGVKARRAVKRVLPPAADRVAQVAMSRFLLPDHVPEWSVACARKARELGPFDAVWVTAPPFGATIVGVAVARAIDRPLVVDFRDPWTQAPRFRPRRVPIGVPDWMLEGVEEIVLRAAAGVSYIYPENLAWNRARFGEGRAWEVIPNGFDAEDVPACAPATFAEPTLVYTGSCYGGRSMLPIFTALAAEARAGAKGPRVLVHGELDAQAQAFLASHPELGPLVDVRPRVGLDRIAPLIRGADALLLLTGVEHKHAVGAKLFDYLLVRRPVLAYGPRDSSAAEIVRTTGAGVWIASEDGEDALRGALRALAARALPFAPDDAQIHRWSADATAERTAALLDRVVR